MVAVTISEAVLRKRAKDLLNGDKSVGDHYLLTGIFATSLIPKPIVAEKIGVQPNQVGKFTSPKNRMPRGSGKILAEAILAAPTLER